MPKISFWAVALLGLTGVAAHADPRDAVEERVGSYSSQFFRRHNTAFRVGAAIHYARGKAHDVLQLTSLFS